MKIGISLLIFLFLSSCANEGSCLRATAIETSESGENWTEVDSYDGNPTWVIKIDTSKTFQSITGFGGAFTESSAHLLMKLSPELREEVLRAYFDSEGCGYSLCRTHMNSSDFSLGSYSYAPIENDVDLEHFSIEEDRDDIIPVIKQAQSISTNGFKLIASPWTAPPWMKDNKAWFGGKLLPEYYSVWGDFFSRYIEAYEAEGIDIWAVTVENEPLGNDSHWESMHYTPDEMREFVVNHLAPSFEQNHIDARILIYDQNKGPELEEWGEALLTDSVLNSKVYGTAVHWYNSTYEWFPNSLQRTHDFAPSHHIISTEACVDAEVPHWRDDAWYWKKEATDWGWDWASPETKHYHTKYVPAYRYARDIIGDLNNWVEGWVDWNMVLDRQGGPNHAQNWCVAPVIADTSLNEVYYTPLYYVMGHFSKFIRPGAVRVALDSYNHDGIMTTCFRNEDGSFALVLLNMTSTDMPFEVRLNAQSWNFRLRAKSIQTVQIQK
ncbi:MAG: glycoside hydrolase family 30 protein [Flavobacteriia bacterium]|nr:glycoside hydrolase family 30 protein [Flavobacteriia bacterium]